MGNKGHEGVQETKGKVQVIYRSHSPKRSYHPLYQGLPVPRYISGKIFLKI